MEGATTCGHADFTRRIFTAGRQESLCLFGPLAFLEARCQMLGRRIRQKLSRLLEYLLLFFVHVVLEVFVQGLEFLQPAAAVSFEFIDLFDLIIGLFVLVYAVPGFLLALGDFNQGSVEGLLFSRSVTGCLGFEFFPETPPLFTISAGLQNAISQIALLFMILRQSLVYIHAMFLNSWLIRAHLCKLRTIAAIIGLAALRTGCRPSWIIEVARPLRHALLGPLFRRKYCKADGKTCLNKPGFKGRLTRVCNE